MEPTLCACGCGQPTTIATQTRKARGIVKGRPNRFVTGHSPKPISLPKLYPSEHGSWSNMCRRCTSPCATGYEHYGGRGITVCDRWLRSFKSFLEDVGPKPSPEYTIERLDNNGNYSPENCAWRTWEDQQKNKRPRFDNKLNPEAVKVIRFLAERGVSKSLLARLHKVGITNVCDVVKRKIWKYV